MAKKILKSALTGEQGIALIHRRVLEMGFVWHQRSVDAGIDGEIELRDPVSGAALNRFILVQSKASDRPFPGETQDSFHYVCSERDIEYWLAGNAPVILVCSHPASQEAWWVSLKEWFAEPSRRAARRVEFDKRTQRLDGSSAQALMHLGAPAGSGLYLRPPPRPERLVSNLLRVEHSAPEIFCAPTECRTPPDAYTRLEEQGRRAGDWLLRDRRVYALRPLDAPPLDVLCDGPASAIPTADWAESDDQGVTRKFVQLLNMVLADLRGRDLRWHRDKHYLYFRATSDLRPRKERSGRRRGGKTVFQRYMNKRDETRVAYYRHAAVRRQFVRLDGQWYLELVPTYHFTWDGIHESKFTGELLAKIKRLERNAAVLGWVRFWAHYFRGEETLLEHRDERLSFGDLALFDVDLGIDDASWKRPKEQPDAEQVDGLFEVA